MGLTFKMGNEVLSQLTKKTSTSTEDLGSLVQELARSAEPLQGKFNGAGRAAFDQFKMNSEEIAVELNQSLGAVLQGISGMDRSFAEGDSEMGDEIRQTQSTVSFDDARFGAAR